MQQLQNSTENTSEKPSFRVRMKHLGWLGVLFFTVKGLLWLLIPFLIAKGCM